MWEIITDSPGTVAPGYIPGRFGPRNDIACDQFATITDYSEMVDNLPPPVTVATTSANAVQFGKIDQHLTIDNTLRGVSFCGKIYQAEQVIIDGVDVVQRIAELATNGQLKNGEIQIENDFCKYLSDYMYSKKVIGSDTANELTISEISILTNEAGHKIYYVFIANSGFALDATTKYIYSIGAFDGNLNGPVGELE